MLYDIIPIRAEEAFSKALQCDTIELSISRSHSFLPDNQSNRVSSVNGTSYQCDVNDNVDGITDEGNNITIFETNLERGRLDWPDLEQGKCSLIVRLCMNTST